MITRRRFLSVAASGLVLVRKPGWALARQARRRVGVNVLGLASEMVPIVKRLGITQVRTTLYWGNSGDPRRFNTLNQLDPKGLTPAEQFAREVSAFRSAELDVLAVVHSPPQGMTLEQGIATLPAFLAARASLFKGLSWQIMNEMDGEDGFNAGWFHAADPSYSQAARGELYGRLLAPVYQAVKAADSTARVIGGGISREPTGFFAGLAKTAPGKYDAIAVHCYGQPLIQQFRGYSIAMRGVLGRTPLWCTEWGFDSADDAAQAQQIATCLDDNDRNDRYDRNYSFALVTGAGSHFGVVSPGGAMRAAGGLLSGRAAP